MIKSLRNTALLAVAISGLISTSQAALPDARIVKARDDANATASIEDITFIGQEAGFRIGKGEIAMTSLNVKSLGKYMASAIIARSSSVTENNDTNKVDEIGEAGAYIIRQVANNVGFKNATRAKAMSLALLQGVLANAKTNTALLAKNLIRDVVGSFALTIHNTPASKISNTMEATIKNYLIANAGIVGTAAQKAKVIAALKAGFAGTATANRIFEDGNIFNVAQVNDPETDVRNG